MPPHDKQQEHEEDRNDRREIDALRWKYEKVVATVLSVVLGLLFCFGGVIYKNTLDRADMAIALAEVANSKTNELTIDLATLSTEIKTHRERLAQLELGTKSYVSREEFNAAILILRSDFNRLDIKIDRLLEKK